ncbi:MAG: serine protease [bacterium]
MSKKCKNWAIVHQLVLLLLLIGLLFGSAASVRAFTLIESGTLSELLRSVEPSVVWIVAKVEVDQWSQGTGFVINENGYILTSAHVVENSNDIRVGWPSRYDRSECAAEIVSSDPNLDLAVLKIPASHLSPLPMDLSGSVDIGDEVITMGFPVGDQLGLQSLTVTRGIVSGVRETMEGKVIQTDAAVTLGCSGGPLFDLNTGSVVGVVKGKGMYMLEGFNFAVPIDGFYQLAGVDSSEGADKAVRSLAPSKNADYSEPIDRAREIFDLGIDARSKTRWGEALSIFLAAERLDNEDPLVAYRTAESYAALGQSSQSLRWLERAFKLGYSDFGGALDSDGFEKFKGDERFVCLVESF